MKDNTSFELNFNQHSMFEAENDFANRKEFLRPFESNFNKLIFDSDPSGLSILQGNTNENANSFNVHPLFYPPSNQGIQEGSDLKSRRVQDDDLDCSVNLGDADDGECDDGPKNGDGRRYSVDSASLRPKRQINNYVVPI